MTRNQIIIRPVGTSVYRRQHFLDSSPSSSRGRIAEVAGGTAAECAAVFCCCPLTLVNLFVLAVYKLPAGICRKALRKHKRRQMIKKGTLPLQSSVASWDLDEFELGQVPECQEVAVVMMGGNNEMDNELMQFEKEMWDKFYSTGFWRSPSQREL